MTQTEQRLIGQLETKVDRVLTDVQEIKQSLAGCQQSRSDYRVAINDRISKLESREVLRTAVYPAMTGAGITGVFWVVLKLLGG